MPVEQIESRGPGYAVLLPGMGNTAEYEYVPGVNFYRRKEREPGARPVLIVPPLGNTGIAVEYIAQKLEILTAARFSGSILPLPVTERTKRVGISDSPATICFPFKIHLGYLFERLADFSEKVKSGVDGNFYPLILTHVSSGPCRERIYGPAEELILRDSPNNPHKDFDFYAAHESLPGILELISFFSHLSGKPQLKVIRLLNETIGRLDMVEKFEDRVRYVQSLVLDFYAAEKVLNEAKCQAASTGLTNSELKVYFGERLKEVDSLTRVREKPEGVIALTGEIFQCEEFMGISSHYLGREVLKQGFYFRREVGLHHYTSRFRFDLERLTELLLHQINPFERDSIKERAARGGLRRGPGGHGMDVVELAQRQKESNEYDGILIIFPFSCLPSITVAGIVNRIRASSPEGINLLELEIDAQSGAGGYITRIEAFLETIQRKKLQAARNITPGV